MKKYIVITHASIARMTRTFFQYTYNCMFVNKEIAKDITRMS